MILNYGWLNIGSFILGLIAWMIPIYSMIQPRKTRRNHSILILLSISACAISLWFQIAYNTYLVEIQDWTVLLDTSNTLNWVAAILLIVTIFLNIISLIVYRNTVFD
ncbi:hypothetical protein LZ578_04400 [Jeotgalibaca sp. MA1X17-3]|uniref:hypothetical protein n=1 Tax=Jeotgalibaca sp. MA1X17-3 TaxID=2908211 RepID=UPI001F21606F|nr:hypothetical protein [Jeotgalibaca sp. MA1X17-3]UJF16369.1 hypothetical protein LZ578_04400 [Jeotgalibaca sp. MA1X17-3]